MRFHPSLGCSFRRHLLLGAAVGAALLLGHARSDGSAYGQTHSSATAPWQLPGGPTPGRYVPASTHAPVGRSMAFQEPAEAAMDYGEAAGWEGGGPSSFAPAENEWGGQSACGPGAAGCGYGGSCGWGDDCVADPVWGGCGVNPCFDRLYFRGEYLLWWGKSATVPVLATTSLPGTPIDRAGIRGLPTTIELFGGEQVDPGAQSGGRFSVGWWFSPCRTWGLETTYLFLGDATARSRLTSAEYPILARPYFNAARFAEDAIVLAYPGVLTGTLRADLSSRLDSVEVLLRRAGTPQCNGQVDFVMGYRYARLAERLAVESMTSLDQLNIVGEVADRFDAHNEFHGAQIGLTASTRYCYWSLELTAKLALGGTWSRVTVDGDTVVTAPPFDPLTLPGGMLALQTNMGVRERTSFSAIPELGVTVSRDLTCRLRATFGYTFLYWSQVARPGDQVDTDLDPSRFPIPQGPPGFPAPRSRFLLTDYWAQGLNFGLDYRF